MPLYPSVDRRPVYFGQDGRPLSYGRIFYYEVGSTSIKKTVYTDRALTVPADNSQLLNEFGRTDTEIFLGSGDYTIVSKKYVGTGVGAEAEGSIYWENDNQWDDSGAVAGSTPSDGEMAYVDTIENLRDLDTATGVVTLLGYYSAGDKAPIVYRWVDGSLNNENYGTYIKSAVDVGGTWEAEIGAEVDAKHFGLGITADAKNAETTAFVFYCYNTSKVARWSSGTYVVNYSGTTTIGLASLNTFIDDNAYFSNTGAGKILVNIGLLSEMNRTGAIQGGSSVGIVVPDIDSILDQDVRPAWYGLGNRDTNDVFSDIITYCNVANKIRIDSTMTIDNGGWSNPLPCLVFYKGGQLQVTGLSGANKVKFTKVERVSADSADGIYTTNSGYIDFSNFDGVVRTSFFTDNTALNAIAGMTTAQTGIILDSIMPLSSDATVSTLYVENGGKVTASASLTVSTKLVSESPFFDAQATGNLLKYADGELKSLWFTGTNKIASLFNSASSASNNGSIDFAGDADTWANLTWTADADYLKIKNLQTVACNFKFNPSGTITQLELENCDIISSTTGVFLPLASVITIRNSKIALSTLYPNASFGKMLQSATDTSLYIYDSQLSASIMFDGEGANCEIVGSKIKGECNYGVTGTMTIQSSELGNTSTVYYTAQANKLRGNNGLSISSVVNTISDLEIYSGSAYFSNQRITGLTIDGMSSNRSPNLQFLTSHAGTSVISLLVDGVSFRNGSGATASSVNTVVFDTTGSGTWTAVQDVKVRNTVATNIGDSYYIVRESSGRFTERLTVQFTNGIYEYSKLVYPIGIGTIANGFKFSLKAGYGEGDTTPNNSFLLANGFIPSSLSSTLRGYIASINYPTSTKTYTFDLTGEWSIYGG